MKRKRDTYAKVKMYLLYEAPFFSNVTCCFKGKDPEMEKRIKRYRNVGLILKEKFDLHYIVKNLTHLLYNQKFVMEKLGIEDHSPENIMDNWLKE